MASEHSWDYDCPQYFDFEAPQQSENVDSWFDRDHENDGVFIADNIENIEPEEVFPVAQNTRSRTLSNTTPKASRIPRSRSHTPRVSSSSKLQEANDNKCNESDGRSKQSLSVKDQVFSTPEPMTSSKMLNGYLPSKVDPPSNLCQSLSKWKKKTGDQKCNQERFTGGESWSMQREPPSSKKHLPAPKHHTPRNAQHSDGTRKARALTRSQSLRQGSDRINTKNGQLNYQGKPPGRLLGNKSLDRNQNIRNGRTASRSPHSLKRSLSKEPAGKDDSSKAVNKSTDSGPSCKAPRLVRPTTPTCLKRMPGKGVNDSAKTSEQLEIERIAYLRKELAKKREMSQKSYQKAMVSKGYAPIASAKEPTAAEEFHFQTDSRIKSHDMETRNDSKHKDFISGLRSQDKTCESSTGPKKATRPQPFHLTESNKSKPKVADNYKSVAEQVVAFHKQTPERYRKAARSQSLNRKRERTRSPKGVTIPETPNLETRGRSRPVTAPTQQEIEEKELEEIKKHQFKANPVNEKIFQGAHGIKKVRSKSVTKPVEFNLPGSKFIKANKSHEEEKKVEFKAQPVPKKILEGPVGVKPAKEVPVTIPESPAFALKHRARIPIEVPEEDTKSSGPMARPVPHMGIPFQPTLSHKTTVPEPFNFEARDKERKAQKELKIQEYLEEEKRAREFHANPIPSSGSALPSKPIKPPTVPEPFNLEIDHRGQKRAEEWRHKLEEELKQQREASKFKAKPTTVLQQDPFLPQKSGRGPTVVKAFALNTEERAEQRDELEIVKKHKQAELEGIKRQQEKEEEEKEKQAISKLRQEMVHKSNPVRKYKRVEPQATGKPLTLPESPVFATNTRLRSHMHV